MAQYHHLNFDERLTLEQGLKSSRSLTEIAKELGRDRKTLAYEIKTNRTFVYRNAYLKLRNNCSKAGQCWLTHVCKSCMQSIRCSLCEHCNKECQEFEAASCPNLEHSPFCCNGCKKQRNCRIKRYIYVAKHAQLKSEKRRSESRAGHLLTEDQLRWLSDFLLPLIKQGQSIHHIYIHHASQMPCSERTVYELIHDGLLDVKSIDLIATVQRKIRRKKPEHKVDPACVKGRTHEDYQAFMADNPGILPVEMDSVESLQGEPTSLLSLSWPHLQLVIPRVCQRRTAYEVLKRMRELHQALGQENFTKLFPLILTDRGAEFSDPSAIEALGTKIFYCDPMRSNQKPHIERCNSYIRRIIPKGYSFLGLPPEDALLMANHINSYARPSLNDKAPIDVLASIYSEDIVDALGLRRIPHDEVCLRPSLLDGRTKKPSGKSKITTK